MPKNDIVEQAAEFTERDNIMKDQMKNNAIYMGLLLGLGMLTACGNVRSAEAMRLEIISVMEEASAAETTGMMEMVETVEMETTPQEASEAPTIEAETEEEMITVYRNTKQYVYSAWSDEEEEYQLENEYDDNGNVIRQTRIDQDGTGYVQYECKYDSNGNELLWISYDDDGSIIYQDKYEYNADGRPLRCISYIDGSVDENEKYEYDADGNRRVICYDDDGNVRYTDEDICDSSGNLLKRIRHNRDGTSYVAAEMVYDAKGNLIKSTTYNEDGSLESEDEYSSDGNIQSSTYVWNDGDGTISTSTVEYQYDEHGNTAVMVYQYVRKDAYGNTIGDESAEETTYENKYDRNENLIKVVEYKDSVLGSVTERKYNENGVKIKEKQTSYNAGKSVYETRELEYDENGNEIRSITYDKDGTIVLLYESEYTIMQIPKRFARE